MDGMVGVDLDIGLREGEGWGSFSDFDTLKGWRLFVVERCFENVRYDLFEDHQVHSICCFANSCNPILAFKCLLPFSYANTSQFDPLSFLLLIPNTFLRPLIYKIL